MRAKFIYEKFSDESDPIHDMGIGMRKQIIKWIAFINIIDDKGNAGCIRKYYIDKNMEINVNYNLILPDDIGNLPDFIQFNKVRGTFNCCACNMTSMKGFPKYIYGDFYADNNKFTSLKYIPKYIGGDFDMNKNSGPIFYEKQIRRVCDVKGDVTI